MQPEIEPPTPTPVFYNYALNTLVFHIEVLHLLISFSLFVWILMSL